MGRPRILVIDDEREIRETLADILGTDRHGRQGRPRTHRPESVRSDLVRSSHAGDGRALYNEVRRDYPHALKRIVFATAQAHEPEYGPFLRETGTPVQRLSGTWWNGWWDEVAMPFGNVAGTQPRTRRFSPRARVSWTVWARHGQQRMRFHTVDVSPRGAKLRPKGSYPVGTALQLEFIAPDGGRLHVSGVVWRADADGVAILFLGTIPKGFDALGQRSWSTMATRPMRRMRPCRHTRFLGGGQ